MYPFLHNLKPLSQSLPQKFFHKISENMLDTVMSGIYHRHIVGHGIDPLMMADISGDIHIAPHFSASFGVLPPAPGQIAAVLILLPLHISEHRYKRMP